MPRIPPHHRPRTPHAHPPIIVTTNEAGPTTPDPAFRLARPPDTVAQTLTATIDAYTVGKSRWIMQEGECPMSASHQTSTGHAMSDGDWLDTHYLSSRAEYEDGLRWVGLQPGWRVLDAGCGGGSFLPLMSELVGATGTVTALDLAPENIARVTQWARTRGVENVSAQEGSIVALPFPDASFDAIWSANVFQYLTEQEAARALAEFRRVVRPGGTVAVKEFDAWPLRLYPMDEGLFAEFQSGRRGAMARSGKLGGFCGDTMPGRLRAAGFDAVRARGWVVDRRAPLPIDTRRLLEGVLRYWGTLQAGLDFTDAGRAAWNQLGEKPEILLDDPNFYYREGFFIAAGTVPS